MSAKSARAKKTPVRRKFLVVVDKSPEGKIALRFAARRAAHTGGLVTLLCVASPADFQQWAGVERVMREEAHQEAERLLHEAAKMVNDLAGIMPELVVREGRVAEEVVNLIKEDAAISILVLGAGLSNEGPGPLVSLIAQVNAYPIPVTIVPGNLTDEQVDALA
ncbi:MAG: universal stress protein [Alphaproteobacteria bacterium]